MYTKMVNGQKKSDIKLFSCSTDTCRALHTYYCAQIMLARAVLVEFVRLEYLLKLFRVLMLLVK